MENTDTVYHFGIIISVGSALILILSLIKIKNILGVLFNRYTFYMACATIASIELASVALLSHNNLIGLLFIFSTQLLGYLWLVWAYLRQHKTSESGLLRPKNAIALTAISVTELALFGLINLFVPNSANALLFDPFEVVDIVPAYLVIMSIFLTYLIYCAIKFLSEVNNVKQFGETKRSKFQRIWFSILVVISLVFYCLTFVAYFSYLLFRSTSLTATIFQIRDNSLGFIALMAFIATSVIDHKIYSVYNKISQVKITELRKQMEWFYRTVSAIFPAGYQSNITEGESEEEQLNNEVDWIGDIRITLYRAEAWHKALELGLPIERVTLPSRVSKETEISLWEYYLSNQLAANEAKAYSQRLSPILAPELDEIDVQRLAKYQIKIGNSVKKRLHTKNRVHNRPKIRFLIKPEEGLNDENREIISINENELVSIIDDDNTNSVR